MVRAYDNWGTLVHSVLQRERDLAFCYARSSISSESSSSFDDLDTDILITDTTVNHLGYEGQLIGTSQQNGNTGFLASAGIWKTAMAKTVVELVHKSKLLTVPQELYKDTGGVLDMAFESFLSGSNKFFVKIQNLPMFLITLDFVWESVTLHNAKIPSCRNRKRCAMMFTCQNWNVLEAMLKLPESKSTLMMKIAKLVGRSSCKCQIDVEIPIRPKIQTFAVGLTSTPLLNFRINKACFMQATRLISKFH